jgi:hypothetical protein
LKRGKLGHAIKSLPTRRKTMNMKQPAKPQPAPANKAPEKPQQKPQPAAPQKPKGK